MMKYRDKLRGNWRAPEGDRVALLDRTFGELRAAMQLTRDKPYALKALRIATRNNHHKQRRNKHYVKQHDVGTL
eukprot:3262505-Pyramimonas_sp.AAC.1